MIYTPEDYQKDGIKFLKSRQHALLADDMGLGKTPQAIWAAHELGLQKIMVVCPAIAKYNWQAEILKFCGRPAKVAGEGVTHWNAPIVICSYDYAVKYWSYYKEYKRDLLILDESHLLKEPSAERTAKILGKDGLIHSAKRTWALSGTPAPSHAGELWTLLYTFGYVKLSYDGFIARYCHCHVTTGIGYIRTNITGTNTANSPELKKILSHMSLRRLKKDVLKDLPPITHNTFYIKGDDESKILKRYPELKEKLQNEIEILKEKLDLNDLNINDEKIISSLQFLGQSISSLRRYHGLRKIKETAALVNEELENNQYEKIIIFGIHTDVLETLQKEINFPSILITGKTSEKIKKSADVEFQTNDKVRVFIGNIQATGTALTLTAASQVLFIEQDWVPGNNRQACDRAHRYGQKEIVNARYIAIKDSLDAKITGALTRKIKEIQTFLS